MLLPPGGVCLLLMTVGLYHPAVAAATKHATIVAQ
jgi:hypothetical protein